MQVARSLAALALALVIAGCGAAGPAESLAEPAGLATSIPRPAAGSPAAAVSPDPAASPAASGATAAEIEQLLAAAMSAPIDLTDPGPALDRAEQAMKDDMRQTTGIAELLGPDGAAILAGIDTAEKALIAGMVAELRGQAALPRVGVQLASVVTNAPPADERTDAQGGGESLFGAFLFTMMAPDLYAKAPRDTNGNLKQQTATEEMTSKDGSTIRLTLKPSLSGSKLSAEVKVEITVPGPPAYTEQATGTLTADLCPDAYGIVPLGLSLGGGYSLGGGGMEYKVTVAAIGHTDDNAKLGSMDLATAGSMAVEPPKGEGWLFGKAPMSIEMRAGFSIDPGSDAVRNKSFDANPSWLADTEFIKTAFGMTHVLGTIAAILGFKSAEDKWMTGYCLEIAVPSMDAGGSKSVATGSTTPFTANVRHKFEGADQAVPVSATLGSGGVSVSPSGSKVPAPATFSYLAPDKDRQTAAVNLETRSKRGVATLAITFMTASPGWVLRGPGGAILGKKCDGVGGDWIEELTVPSLGMTNRWIFTIDGTTLKGTYTMDAVQALKGGSGTWHGTGEASVALRPDGTAEIGVTGGKVTITTKTASGTAKQTAPGPEGQHSVWMPAGDACR